MSLEAYSFRLLKSYIDSLLLTEAKVDEKVIGIIAYGMAVGGCLSEWNVLAILEYAQIDSNNENDFRETLDLFAFFVGAGFIEIINNGFGLCAITNNVEYPSHVLGISSNDAAIRAQVDKVVQKFVLEYRDMNDQGSEEQVPAQENSYKPLGTVFCPKCNETIEIIDVKKFQIHYPIGIANPTAEIKCQECGFEYKVYVSWPNAYKFDVLGCPASPLSFSRAKPIEEKDVTIFMADFDDGLDIFLDAVEKER